MGITVVQKSQAIGILETVSQGQIATFDAMVESILVSSYGSYRIEPPIDPNKVINANGVGLQEGTFEDPGVAAVYEREISMITVAADDTLIRRRLAVACCLGYHFIHTSETIGIVYKVEADTLIYTTSRYKQATPAGQLAQPSDEEIASDRRKFESAMAFGASLLTPSFLLREYRYALNDESRLARLFSIPRLAMHYRLGINM